MQRFAPLLATVGGTVAGELVLGDRLQAALATLALALAYLVTEAAHRARAERQRRRRDEET